MTDSSSKIVYFSEKIKGQKTAKLDMEFSNEAMVRWDQISLSSQKLILSKVWCVECRKGVEIQLKEGRMEGKALILGGVCKICGGKAVRVVEPEE